MGRKNPTGGNMSVVLYKKGDTHIIRGLSCDIKLVRPDRFNGPEDGWFMSPEKAYEKPIEEKPFEHDPKEEIIETIVDIKPVALDYDKMSNPKIREHAKKAGIKNWKDARIKTLKDELKGE